uniref:CUB_2 domain-containing protein n=1 Tax=Caenorhabditis tropicalis TaxID=1561998 RepID=A0A1I7TPY2_9PELO
MKSLARLLCYFVVIEGCLSAQTVPLYWYSSTTPTKIDNVLDGSKLYMASSDSAVHLSKITVSSNGQTKTLQQLIGDFDVNGFMNGFPVNSDLTISTTNSGAVTDELHGILLISSPDMAKDPNFLVYLVSDQTRTIDRLDYNDTTLVLLNVKVSKLPTDPAAKPFTSCRVENINQAKNTQLYIYQDIPGDGYTDPTLRETSAKLIFRNPVQLLPTGTTVDTVFFDNIEPIQYTLRTWHIRAVGGGISFNVSREWKDQTNYQTTKESTTGYTMSQASTYQSNITYKYTPNHDAVSGYMITTKYMFADMSVTTCNQINCTSEPFLKTVPVTTDFFQSARNDTVLSVNIAKVDDFGYYSLQYFRTEQNVLLPNNSTSTALPESTTKSGSALSFILAIISMILHLFLYS